MRINQLIAHNIITPGNVHLIRLGKFIYLMEKDFGSGEWEALDFFENQVMEREFQLQQALNYMEDQDA